MKINKATKTAIAATKAAHAGKTVKAITSAKVATKGKDKAKQVATVAVKAASLVGERIAVITGAKGNVVRLCKLYSDNSFKLLQNHNGVFDGATLGADSSKWDKEQRLQVGNYVCSKGGRATIKFLTLDDARKLFTEKHKIERNGREIVIQTAKGAKIQQYNGSLEMFTNKTTGKKFEHWFQWETKKLDTNKLHFAAMVS